MDFPFYGKTTNAKVSYVKFDRYDSPPIANAIDRLSLSLRTINKLTCFDYSALQNVLLNAIHVDTY